MTRYFAFDHENEIPGFSTMALLTTVQHQDIAPILHKHGLDKIDPTQWYQLQAVLDVLNEVAAQPNASLNLVSIGVAAAQQGIDQMSAEAKATPFEAFIMNYPKIYVTRIRGGEIGEIVVEKISETQYQITMRVPFPDDLYYGLLYGYVRHFRPQNKRFSLRYAPNLPRRDDGGEFTVIDLELT